MRAGTKGWKRVRTRLRERSGKGAWSIELRENSSRSLQCPLPQAEVRDVVLIDKLNLTGRHKWTEWISK